MREGLGLRSIRQQLRAGRQQQEEPAQRVGGHKRRSGGKRLIQRSQGMRAVADESMGGLGKGGQRRAAGAVLETIAVSGGHDALLWRGPA